MQWKAWFLAARPKTLGAAIVPVLLATSFAFNDGQMQVIPAILCLLFAVGIQIGTNFANDYYDFVQGADGEQRIGPRRAVAQGWISPKAMKWAFLTTFLLTFLLGAGLIPYGGWELLWIGLASVLCGIAYTGGPYPLGYHGLGDVFVFLFFGWVATAFTYYVQAGTFDPLIWVLGIIPGAISTNLLVVNNHRDASEDEKAGKRTLVVRFGKKFAENQYRWLTGLSYAASAVLAVSMKDLWLLLPFFSLPLAWRLVHALPKTEGMEAYAGILAGTAKLLFMQGLLLSAGFIAY